ALFTSTVVLLSIIRTKLPILAAVTVVEVLVLLAASMPRLRFWNHRAGALAAGPRTAMGVVRRGRAPQSATADEVGPAVPGVTAFPGTQPAYPGTQPAPGTSSVPGEPWPPAEQHAPLEPGSAPYPGSSAGPWSPVEPHGQAVDDQWSPAEPRSPADPWSPVEPHGQASDQEDTVTWHAAPLPPRPRGPGR
ncbi:MAG TPA: hypothetical protein VG253_16815, partial [Streptosporangiaceae bacterium]|nr:hypothetical protein [Streptosporangiaceae bacterium]